MAIYLRAFLPYGLRGEYPTPVICVLRSGRASAACQQQLWDIGFDTVYVGMLESRMASFVAIYPLTICTLAITLQDDS